MIAIVNLVHSLTLLQAAILSGVIFRERKRFHAFATAWGV
jgi:hypothetical protein